MRKGRYLRRKIWVLKRSVSAKISVFVRTVCVICCGKVGGSKVFLIASAVVLFMRWRGRLCIYTQKAALSKVASSTDSSPVGFYKPMRYLSEVQGPCTVAIADQFHHQKL